MLFHTYRSKHVIPPQLVQVQNTNKMKAALLTSKMKVAPLKRLVLITSNNNTA